jgi:hypothetical protein
MNRAKKKDRPLNLDFCFRQNQPAEQRDKGQAVVEFTLVFMLFLIIAFIPADFGLAFLTGQLAQNASREGARIAAADPCLMGFTSTTPGSPILPCLITGATAQPVSCNLGSCPTDPVEESVLEATAKRLSSALLPGAQITLTYSPCATAPTPPRPNIDHVIVTVDGDYNYFFLGFLGWLGVSVPASENIVRSTDMRWEHRVCPS